MIVGTVIRASELAKAKTMAESVKAHHQATVVVCLLEEDPFYFDILGCQLFDKVVLAKDIGFHDFYRFIFLYSPIEGGSAVKGQFMQYLYHHYPNEENFLYIDPELLLFSPIHEFMDRMQYGPLLLVTRRLTPSNELEELLEMNDLKEGPYDSGLIGVRRSAEGGAFVRWWSDMLARCFTDGFQGPYMDQKWLNFAPALFSVDTFKHPGYQVAAWNLYERNIWQAGELGYCINGMPLRTFHFRNSYGQLQQMLQLYDGQGTFQLLYDLYLRMMDRHQPALCSQVPWSYDFFVSGEPIMPLSRANYRQHGELRQVANPFELDNEFFSNV